MSMTVHGHILSAPFIFVCDGKVYYSYAGKNWTVVFDRSGTKSWGNMTYGIQRVDRPCPSGRNSEVHLAFRGAVMRHFNLNYTQIDAFLVRQANEDKQILVEGSSVKRHVSGRSSLTKSTSYPAQATVKPSPSAPVAKPVKREKSPEEVIRNMTPSYVGKGLPAEYAAEFHEWFRKRTGRFLGVKLADVIAVFLAEEKTPVVAAPDEVAAEAVKPKKVRTRTLIEEREHREDVPFYGRRRRDQAQFRADVELNCGKRCVITAASSLRCEAAHLIPHARQGGASFKNGLLLRADMHKLFDDGYCAINPETLELFFADEVLALDPDLLAWHGKTLRPTKRPINQEFLRARWDNFRQTGSRCA